MSSGPNNFLPDPTANKKSTNQYQTGTDAIGGGSTGDQVSRHTGTGNNWRDSSNFAFISPGTPGAPQAPGGGGSTPQMPVQAKVTEEEWTLGD